MKKPNIILKVYNKKGKMIQRWSTPSKMKIYDVLAWELKNFAYFTLRVSYSRKYKNEGEYTTKKDLIHALRAFTEPDLVKEFCEE